MWRLSNTQAILVLAVAAVGLGDIWRLPSLAINHGGGAFLIVYVIALLALGAPVLMAELFADYWARDRDLADHGVLRAALQRAGLDEALLERTADPEVKKALIDATTAAAERGVFGVPTWGVGDQLFWGQDRIPLVERALRGWRPQLPEDL